MLTPSSIEDSLSRMILSASGWRTVFAADSNEHSTTDRVDQVHLAIAVLAAQAYSDYLLKRCGSQPVVLVGTDTRPTGPAIARAAIRGLLDRDITPTFLSVSAAPEIAAFAGSLSTDTTPAGFCYISASHNPLGHNGLKLGDPGGAVLGGAESQKLISRFRDMCGDSEAVARAEALLEAETTDAEREVLSAAAAHKSDAIAVYRKFSLDVAAGPGPDGSPMIDSLATVLAGTDARIVADLNGSARILSIDRDLFTSLGCRYDAINDTPGVIAHQIVPEGAGLDECRTAVGRVGAEAVMTIGYVPDNDGDRGNLVYYDERSDTSRSVPAQEVFALSCVAELCWLQASRAVDFGSHGNDDQRVAVVVNGPTSNRIDSICDLFGVEVHRAEVGEANVVNRAAELRRDGYLVRLLGEGSNGGNITHPSTIRDPLQTVLALLKLLFSPGSGGRPAPLEIWWERRGVAAAERTATVAGVISSLPRYTTTSAFEDRAIMKIGSTSHAALKREFEALIPEAVAGAGAWLAEELGRRCRLVNYEGTREFPGPGGRTGAETGGLKVIFSDDDGHDTGYAWMRGSGTEPVFRVMADVEGDRPETEERLLDWQKNLVAQADRRAQQ